MGSTDSHSIILYTAHRCPWAHRVHIALSELGLPFTEELIDLDVPRPPSYLEVNPRGLVPAIKYGPNQAIITESGIVSQFLADLHPESHLLPPSSTPEGALRRARVNFFVDTFFTKFQDRVGKFVSAKNDDEAAQALDFAVAGLVKEVEPLLKDAGPFFGGSERLTFAEVMTGSFAIRLVSNIRQSIYPASLEGELEAKTPAFWKWAQVVAAHPSVKGIYDEQVVLKYTRARIAKARGEAAK